MSPIVPSEEQIKIIMRNRKQKKAPDPKRFVTLFWVACYPPGGRRESFFFPVEMIRYLQDRKFIFGHTVVIGSASASPSFSRSNTNSALTYHPLRLLTLSQFSFHRTKMRHATNAITEIRFALIFGSVPNSGVAKANIFDAGVACCPSQVSCPSSPIHMIPTP